MSVCSDWNVCATNANGISGGLGVMWNASKISLKAYHYDAGIILTGYLAGSIQRIRIINSYALIMTRNLSGKRFLVRGFSG